MPHAYVTSTSLRPFASPHSRFSNLLSHSLLVLLCTVTSASLLRSSHLSLPFALSRPLTPLAGRATEGSHERPSRQQDRHVPQRHCARDVGAVGLRKARDARVLRHCCARNSRRVLAPGIFSFLRSSRGSYSRRL
ncbi:hypothetical protein BD626DRAFT_509824 [Schizophyllum amplum]|uniref:Uncharacterized protein n=1 Tax=Schizophyllum amplum TaxID=97359 RepID=A0A550C221_9AGAR|nr:hypothetical protein BD626DRAFT_509824 [Auriculariopsis ampla]